MNLEISDPVAERFRIEVGGVEMNSILKNAERYTRNSRPFARLIDEELEKVGKARIIVVGIGGAGNNTLHRLHKIGGIRGAQTIAVNTDMQHLDAIDADSKVLIGRDVTRGLGAGGDPILGHESAEEDRHKLKEILNDANLVFITAGMGGGTGTGASPVIAEVASESGALVIGVITLPFRMEGRHRHQKAELGLKALKGKADTIITLDNNKLLELAPNAPIDYAFSVADEVLAEMVKGISETITEPSLVNLDYADVRTVMTDGGVAMVGLGESNSKNRAQEAVEEALRNRLLEVDYSEAKGALVHVSGGPDMTLSEASQVGEYVQKMITEESQIIWGARVDESLKEALRVMVIMTGVKSPHISGRDADGGRISFEELKSRRSLGLTSNDAGIYSYLGIESVDYDKF